MAKRFACRRSSRRVGSFSVGTTRISFWARVTVVSCRPVGRAQIHCRRCRHHHARSRRRYCCMGKRWTNKPKSRSPNTNNPRAPMQGASVVQRHTRVSSLPTRSAPLPVCKVGLHLSRWIGPMNRRERNKKPPGSFFQRHRILVISILVLMTAMLLLVSFGLNTHKEFELCAAKCAAQGRIGKLVPLTPNMPAKPGAYVGPARCECI